MTKRIVFVNRYFDPDTSASSQMLTDLARGLAARGFDVHVVTSRQHYDDPACRLSAEETLEGVLIHRVPTTRFGRSRLPGRTLDYASFYLTAAWALIRHVGRGTVLIAKTDPPLISVQAALIAALKGAILINWQQDIFPEIASQLGANPLPRWANGILKRLRDASLRAAKVNVLIGERMREYLVARGLPESKLCVIENWADAQAIRPKSTQASELRARLDLAGRFVVCYSGNLGRAHEFSTLLAAAEALRHEPHIVFLIIGAGAHLSRLKQGVAERGLENFRFLPYQPRAQLEDSLAAADVHLAILLPALEGLIVPSKLYGVLAAGRPLMFIGDADGEIGRLILRTGCGCVVPVGDAAGLASALLALESAPARREDMGTRARELLCERFALERAVERWTAQIETP